MKFFECDNVGPLEEYVRCKIEVDWKAGTVKFMQLVFLQSFKDRFDLPGGKTSNYPVVAGSVLTKDNMENVLKQKDQTKY